MKAAACALVLVACTKSAPPAPAMTASAIPVVADASGAVDLATPDFGARGPIVVTGYPKKVGTGMDDPAEYAGFTAGGAQFGYCGHRGGAGEIDCVTRDASGKETVDSDFVNAASGPLDPTKTKAIEKWIATSGLPKLAKAGGFEWMPPPL